jgi:dTDP-4-amino-4,6-dideoxygalactose transaminase
MNDLTVPFHCPSIGEEEIREVVETLRSGWLTTGPRTARFEREFGRYVQARCALALNSATAALHLALAALKIGPGDEVITTPMTFCATVQVILHVGAIPVLADIGPDGNIDPEAIERRITRRTRAIIPVHLAGLPCDMEAIWMLARKHGLAVIEDAAHAVGALRDGRPIGSAPKDGSHASDAVAFSFYATKNMTTGEGGMLTTNRPELAETAKVLALHGTSRDAWDRYTDRGNWYYEVVAHGFKYNLSDIQAAIGLPQLAKIEHFLHRRTEYAHMYHQELSGLDTVELPPDNARCRHAWHLYILRLRLDRLKIDRSQFIRALREAGVGTSVHFIPIPLHPFFAKLPMMPGACPKALDLYPRIVSIPLYPAMTDEQLHHAARTVRTVLENARRPLLIAPGELKAEALLRAPDAVCVPEGSL